MSWIKGDAEHTPENERLAELLAKTYRRDPAKCCAYCGWWNSTGYRPGVVGTETAIGSCTLDFQRREAHGICDAHDSAVLR